jgi:hypothetical protein
LPPSIWKDTGCPRNKGQQGLQLGKKGNLQSSSDYEKYSLFDYWKFPDQKHLYSNVSTPPLTSTSKTPKMKCRGQHSDFYKPEYILVVEIIGYFCVDNREMAR